MVLPFLPNEADATDAIQSEPDSIDFKILLQGFRRSGVVSGIAISENTPTADMTLDITTAGVAELKGTRFSTSTGTVTITTAPSSGKRFDLVVVNASGTFSVIAGTAAAEPKSPSFDEDTYVALYLVTVGTSVTAINDEDIQDKRVPLVNEPGLVPRDSWVDHLFQRESSDTAHTDDAEFASSGLTGFTTITPTGTASWVETRHVAAFDVVSQETADVSAIVKSLTPTSAPVTIETAVRVKFAPPNFQMVGMCFSNGTAATSDGVFLLFYATLTGGYVIELWNGKFNALTAFGTPSIGWYRPHNFGLTSSHLYLRLHWTAANTWAMSWSVDGIKWWDEGKTTGSSTLTPTHIGLLASTWGLNSTYHLTGAYEYLRVYESDLSV